MLPTVLDHDLRLFRRALPRLGPSSSDSHQTPEHDVSNVSPWFAMFSIAGGRFLELVLADSLGEGLY